MTLHEAFQSQIATTRLLAEEDFGPDTGNPVVWNGAIIRPNGNIYSSGQEMKVGDKLLIAYFVTMEDPPVPMLIEEDEIDGYDQDYEVIRLVDHIPVLQMKSTKESLAQ